MKKLKPLIFMVGLLALTGCNGVVETFKIGEFHTTEFKDNYYRFIPERYKTTDYQETVIEVSDDVFFANPFTRIYDEVLLNDINRGDITTKKAVELYGNDATKTLDRADFDSDAEYEVALRDGLSTSSSASWFNYAKHNSLTTGDFGARINNAFKRGIFSKLTDTLILCNGDGSLVRIQIDEDGMGQIFAHELITYRNFVFSARGGTNIDYSSLGETVVSKAKIRLNISFYVEESTMRDAEKITLSFEVPELEVDNNAITTVMSIDLVDALAESGLSLYRVSGMSVDYELLEHDYLMPGGVSTNDPDHEFSLMLYEVMFPYSTWN